MVLSGASNMAIVGAIARAGGKAIGISGKDGGLVTATKLQRTHRDPDSNIEKVLDLGFVGEPSRVDTTIIETANGAGMIPVVAPIGVGEDGHTYNINADTMAGALAAALGAARLLLLTDVSGVLDKQGNLLTDLTPPTSLICAPTGPYRAACSRSWKPASRPSNPAARRQSCSMAACRTPCC